MIREHHKVTSAGEYGLLVEVFRRSDWIDVSLGVRRSGVSRAFVQVAAMRS